MQTLNLKNNIRKLQENHFRKLLAEKSALNEIQVL